MPVDHCLPCQKQGRQPRRGPQVVITFDPAIVMPGHPTIDGSRMGVLFVTEIVWHHGVREVLERYPQDITREQVLTACWWRGRYGTRTWRKRWGTWAEMAGWHLWYRCYNFPDPPTKEGP